MMSEEPIKPEKRSSWVWIAMAAFVGLILGGLAIPSSQPPARGAAMVSINNGKQLRLALQLYAADHGDAMPESLATLFPTYVDGSPEEFAVRDGNPNPPRRYDWLYYPRASFSKAPPDAVVLAAPLATILKPKKRRIIICFDGTSAFASEEEFAPRIARYPGK
ncbi:MAG: hypothetical protein ABJF10_03735 [Chthoniobacter sp.]|uniref:hypothetical protein n=1 Tax=Chthoniobacter sp. TaxID=2510640 RepID=UPI0032A611A2